MKRSADEIIIISDDEKPPKRKSKMKVISPVIDDDIISLSSDSDEHHDMMISDTKAKLLRLHRARIKKIYVADPRDWAIRQVSRDEAAAANEAAAVSQHEATRLTKELALAIKENDLLRAVIKSRESKLVFVSISSVSVMLHILTCAGYVTGRRYHLLRSLQWEDVDSLPVSLISFFNSFYTYLLAHLYLFSLPQCGHVFCGLCLGNWFSTIFDQYLATNPTFDPNPMIPNHLTALCARVRQNPGHPYFHLQLKAELIYFCVTQDLPPPPVYTCPLCRKTVENKPVEDFALKRIVGIIARSMGEKAPENNLYGPGRTPWVGFFGNDM